MRFPNGYGTVYKLSGKRRKPYIVRKTIGWTDEGKQIYSTIGYYRTKAEGLQALAAYNDNPYDLEMSKITFADIYKLWFAETFNDDSNKSTIKNYTSAYNHCSALYKMKMTDIRPHHMQAILDNDEFNYPVVKRIQILFKQLYSWCIRHECIRKNYSECLKINVKYNPTPRNAFSSEEIEKLWDNVEQNEYIKLVLMLIYSGTRIGEMLDLKKEDVNLTKQFFMIKASKTESGIRMVPIADKVLPYWTYFFEKSKCDFAICKGDGRRMSYDNFKKNYWNPIMALLEMNHTAHETRHSCISQLVMKNVNQTVIKKIVGHKSIMNLTEKVYTHIEIKELLDAINKI